MLQKLREFISKVQSDERIQFLDEASTKQGVVLRLLSILGWDTFDIEEVKPEYSVSGRRVDYSLRIHRINKVFIEVKKVGEELERHQEQLLNYSFQEGVKLAVLNNGITWWFYLPLHEGSWDQRKFYTIDILQQELDDVANKFESLLSRSNVESGNSIVNAEELYKSRQKKNILRMNLPKAWNKIISEPDELLIDLINENLEKISGFKADNDQIEQFLSKYYIQFQVTEQPIMPLPTIPPAPRQPQIGKVDNYTGKSISAFSFRNQKYNIHSWKELLINVTVAIKNLHPQDFERCLQLTGRRRPYFSINPGELRSPEKIIGTNIYTETNLSANDIVKISKRLINLFGYQIYDLEIESQ